MEHHASAAASGVALSAALTSYRRVTERHEIEQVKAWMATQPHSAKIVINLEQWLSAGLVAGDQGLVGPAVPILYTDLSSSTGKASVAVLIYGNGDLDEVLARAHAPHEDRVHGPTDFDVAGAADWQHWECSFYVSWLTNGKKESRQLLASLLREVLPWAEPFYFSAITPEYSPLIRELAAEAGATLDWNDSRHWEVTPGDFVRTKDPMQRRLLDGPGQLLDDSTVAPPAPEDVDPDLQFSAAPQDGVDMTAMVIAPLRLEHVDLIVQNWPWSSPSSPGLVRYLIENLLTRCVYIDETPVCWCLEQDYGALGMVHTQAPWRSRGLARLCVESLCDAMLVARGRDVGATITIGNTASERVFTSLGFKPIHGVHWAHAMRLDQNATT